MKAEQVSNRALTEAILALNTVLAYSNEHGIQIGILTEAASRIHSIDTLQGRLNATLARLEDLQSAVKPTSPEHLMLFDSITGIISDLRSAVDTITYKPTDGK